MSDLSAYGDISFRVLFFGDEIESIEMTDPQGATLDYLNEISIFPANNFVTTKERTGSAINNIQDDMMARYNYFRNWQTS